MVILILNTVKMNKKVYVRVIHLKKGKTQHNKEIKM